MRKLLLTVAFSLLAAGCSEHYRYACQDPANWEKPDCKRPQCEVDGNCRDELTGGVSEKILDPDHHKTEEPVNE